MRICLVSNEFAPFHGAGIGTYASLMAAAWAGAGHDVHVLTGMHPGVLEDGPRLRPGVRFQVVDPERGPRIGVWAERYALAALASLERLHAEAPFDYIEFPDYGGEGAYAAWTRRAGGLRASVVGVRLHTPRRECRALNAEAWLDEEGARVDALEDAAIRQCDVLISPSASLMGIVRTRLQGEGRWPREAVVPYPFDGAAVAELLPEDGEEDAEAGALSGLPVVLYFGRLERRKGVEVLVGAAARMLDGGVRARFRLIGGDTLTGPMGRSMRQHLERVAGRHLGTGIVFDESRPRRALGEEIRRAAVVCIPSLWENFPNVVLESMALGACVVGSNAGGIGEIIRDGVDGLLAGPGAGADLERVLRRALADDELRATVGGAAPGRIAGLCDPATVVARTISAIEGARGDAGARGDEATGCGERVSVVVMAGDSPERLGETIASVEGQGGVVGERLTVARGESTEFASRLVCDWVLVLEEGDVLGAGAIARMLAAGGSASWVGAMTSWLEGGAASAGLDRDLLASGVSPGPALVRVEAAARLGAWASMEGPIEWEVACRFAAAGEPWAIAPGAVVSRRCAVSVPASALAQMMEGLPGLAADQTRAVKILAARAEAVREDAARADEARASAQVEATYGPRREVHWEAVFRQRMMEENLRYRLADRVSGLLRASGIQRPVKAIARGAGGLARRLAGG